MNEVSRFENEPAAEKTMTVKEVAAVLGVSRELITKRIRELYPEKMRHGSTTYLNEAEVTVIKKRIEQNAHLATSYDRTKLADMPKTNLEKQLLIRQAMQLQNEMIAELEAENERLKIENAQAKPTSNIPKTAKSYTKMSKAYRLKYINSRKSYCFINILIFAFLRIKYEKD